MPNCDLSNPWGGNHQAPSSGGPKCERTDNLEAPDILKKDNRHLKNMAHAVKLDDETPRSFG